MDQYLVLVKLEWARVASSELARAYLSGR